MGFAAPWALAALAVLVPIVVLSLRRPTPRRLLVASLRDWRDLPAPPSSEARRRLRRPPLLLLLQVLALSLLVLGLARLGRDPGPAPAAPVVIVDSSASMRAGTRLADARQQAQQILRSAPAGSRLVVVAARTPPVLLAATGDRAEALAAVSRLAPAGGTADLADAIQLGLSEAGGRRPQLTLLRAREHPAPALPAALGARVTALGAPLDDQRIEAFAARCSPTEQCSAIARVRNDGPRAVTRQVSLAVDGRTAGRRSLRLPPHGAVALAFSAPAGAGRMAISLDGRDALAVDDRATVTLPSAQPLGVVVSGPAATAARLARSLRRLPATRVTVVPEAQVARRARGAGLVVLAGWRGLTALPPAPAILLVNPASGGGLRLGRQLRAPALTEVEDGSPLLAGVDLTSLHVSRARLVTAPGSFEPVVQSTAGPLLLAGTVAGRRVTVLAFDPAASNLESLAAFPALLANVEQEVRALSPVAGRVPASPAAVAGTGTQIDASPDAVGLLAPPRPRRDYWPLLGIVALGLLLVEWALVLRRPSRLGRRANLAAHAVRAAGLALLVAALLQPVWRGSGPSGRVVVRDVSSSVDAGMRASERGWLAALGQVQGTHVPVVNAAGTASLAATGSALGGETDLEGALDLGISMAPAGGRLTLLSDGRETRGDVLAAAALARRRRVAVDVVALGPRRTPDAALVRLGVPPALRSGDPFALQLTVRSTVARSATLTVTRDGTRLIWRQVRLRAGDAPLLVSLRAVAPGWHVYAARVAMRGDETAANDALAASMRVAPRARVLVVERPGATGGVATALRSQGLAVSVLQSDGLTDAALDGAGALVLDDVPAALFSKARANDLSRRVRQGRLGLFVLGGGHALTLGGYEASPLGRLLPVRSRAPGLRPRALALILVLDRSGSMLNEAGGVPKIRMAQAAALAATKLVARHKDEIALVSFDTDSQLLVPLRTLAGGSAAAAVRTIIQRMAAGGGTNIYTGLLAGFGQAQRSSAATTHVILLTDGVSGPGPYAQLLARMRAADVTLSTVALGTDADRSLLKQLAKVGGGRYAFTANAAALPTIFAKDVQAVVGAARVTGDLEVTSGAASPLTASLAGQQALPELGGLVATTLRAGASMPLYVEERNRRDPVLTSWQVGLGRIAVWTPGVRSWGDAWRLDEPGVFADAVRWSMPAPETPVLEPRLSSVDGRPAVVVDTLANAGRAVELATLEARIGPRGTRLPLTQVAPSRYRALLPRGATGTQTVEVVDGAGRLPSAKAVLAVPYAPELRGAPPDIGLLDGVAAATGGRLLSGPGELAGRPRGDRDLWWPLALAAFVLVAGGILLRLLAGRSRPRRGVRLRPRRSAVEDAGAYERVGQAGGDA